MSEKKCIDIKEPKTSLLSTSFHQATPLHFVTVFSWFEIIASWMANSKLKFECLSCGSDSSFKSEQASLFTIIT